MVFDDTGIAAAFHTLFLRGHVADIHGLPDGAAVFYYADRTAAQIADMVDFAAQAAQQIHGALKVLLHEQDFVPVIVFVIPFACAVVRF